MDLEDYFDDFDDYQEEADTFSSQIVEIIAERCVQQVLDENNPK